MPKIERAIAVGILLLSLITAQGCSSDSKLEVTGNVTLDGQPLEDGIISFLPANGNGPTAEGMVERGHYIVPMLGGEKRVFIKGFKTVGMKYFSGNSGAKYPIKEPIVPKKYNTESQLQVQVDSSHLSYDFPLKSGK